MLIQAHIGGNSVLQSVAAWGGTVLAGYAREKLISHPAPKGPSTLTRTFHCPEARTFAERLAVAFGMSGLFGVEFIADSRTGELYLLEINRRITPGTHVGTMFDIDLCRALHDAISGARATVRTDLREGEEHVIAHFPQEWLRDPTSENLRKYPVDAPWDDPELFQAMLRLRHH
jgi:predicted ATP-grasp superfamily ATP-dependent carboligase